MEIQENHTAQNHKRLCRSYHQSLICNIAAWSNQTLCRGRGSISKVEGHWRKGALLYMTKIKVSNDSMSFMSRTKIFENMESITSETALTESLLLQKGHFHSSKRGRSFKKYFFRSANLAL